MILKVRASADDSPPTISGSRSVISASIRQAERRQRGELLQDRLQFDLLVELSEAVDALLQPLDDRQVPQLDDVADVRLGMGLPDNQEVVELLIHEGAVAPQVRLVDVQPRRRTEVPLEPRHGHERMAFPLPAGPASWSFD